MTSGETFLAVGVIAALSGVCMLYGRQVQIIKKLRSLKLTAFESPESLRASELERKLREADLRIEASMAEISKLKDQTRETLGAPNDKKHDGPQPSRAQVEQFTESFWQSYYDSDGKILDRISVQTLADFADEVLAEFSAKN